MLTLLTGGARSGKSSAAVRLASATAAPVHYLATAQPGDAEMAQRIARHRADRPAGWITVEEPLLLGEAIDAISGDDTLIIDCLGLWVTNRLSDDDAVILSDAATLAEKAAARSGATIVVTNEVGSGIVPDNVLARRFRDLLGGVNQAFAAVSTSAYLCVAGRVLPLVEIDAIR